MVVRDENGGNLRFLLDAADFLARLQAQAGVKVGQRLVQQQHAGHLHQRAGDSDALLLTAGKLAGLAFQQFLNLHQPGGLMRALQHGFLGHLVLAAEVLQREEDVLLDRQMGIERVILEHQTNAAVFRGQIGHIVLPEEDFSAGWLLLIMYSVVLLPQPDGPRRPISFPSGMVKSKLLTATTSSPDFLLRLGKILVRFCKTIFIESPFFALCHRSDMPSPLLKRVEVSSESPAGWICAVVP